MRARRHVTRVLLAICAAFALCVLWPGTAGAQAQRFLRGQNAVPVYEGWEPNADGTFTMWFGYLNRNYEEEIDIPVGEANNFSPGPADRGQMAHFYPRRNPFILRVVVPADWGKQELVWTLTYQGKTEQARGTLMESWAIDEGVIRGNRGRGGGLGDVGKAYEVKNEPPTIAVDGPAQRTIRSAEQVTLSVTITDDGQEPNPPWLKPGRATQDGDQPTAQGASDQPGLPGAPRGGPRRAGGAPVASAQLSPQPVLRPPPRGQRPGVTWTLHRGGPGKVTFSESSPRVKDGKATITASFSEPGTYVLRAYADDGVRTTPTDVTVTVTPGSPKTVR